MQFASQVTKQGSVRWTVCDKYNETAEETSWISWTILHAGCRWMNTKQSQAALYSTAETYTVLINTLFYV